jgi:tRNA 2-thiouridine synthesizing protein A
MADTDTTPADDWASDARLDTSGLRCPEPLMLLRKQVRDVAVGERVHVTATDPASVRDFEQFCHFLGHAIVERAEAGERLDFLIEKGERGGSGGP